MNQVTHPRYSEAEAIEDGWAVFTVDDGRMEIQRYDEYGVFCSDKDARHYVAQMACAGSPIHKAAMWMCRLDYCSNCGTYDIDSVNAGYPIHE